jgi:two-component system, OmpR family, response regulator
MSDERLVVNPILCDAYGHCAELLPELISLDEWGYPVIGAENVPGDLRRDARRAVAACPRLALRLERQTAIESTRLSGDSQVSAPDSQPIPSYRWQVELMNRGEQRTNGAAKVLVVDDEPSIVDAVATALRYEGYDVREEASGRDALAAVVEFEPDLIVLDWMLPDIEGIEVGRRLRDRGFKTAILFLTAKDAVENKVDALRAGGDDYVTKPFSLAEVVARVQAVLRRTGGELPGDVLRFADVSLDESRHEVFRGDTRVDLTATEFSLLRFFLLNPRRVLSKGQILQNVWRYDFGGNSNVVETYVSYLRKKLDALGPPLIRTVRQAGYMLEAEQD